MLKLPEHEYQTFAAVRRGPLSVEAVAQQVKLDQSLVTAAAQALSQRGWVKIEEKPREEFIITDKGEKYAGDFFPERRTFAKIREKGGRVKFQELPKLLGKDEVRSEVKWLTRKGWCNREAGSLVVTKKYEAKFPEDGPDEQFIKVVAGPRDMDTPATREYLKARGVDVDAALKLLKGRGELFKKKRRVRRVLSLTESGERLWAAGPGSVVPAQEVTQLTSELIVSGKWRDVVLKRYDPGLETAPRYPGKPHPLQRIIQETRRAFFEMGFEEAASPVVETAFWDFDALFQPQDHPAREMQDTFYMRKPVQGRLPAEKLVMRVGRTHENGGGTGSTGWRYEWNRSLAKRLVMRTHTTATTIRALAANPEAPRKVFCVGKVFRRENIDPTHLPEFVQIDGVIIDEQASFATLLGTLQEFYRKMGAEELKFRPSFFPYTEPSVEVFVRMEQLGAWIEMGGAGIFRPEVTLPLGCKATVLAWGLGLERLVMLRFGVPDMRKLYWCDIDWLKKAALCR